MNSLSTYTLLMMDPNGKGGGLSSLIPMLLIVVVFYFFMIRPQQKKAKDAKKYRDSLEKGSKIITIGGIHGKIVEVAETTFLIEAEGGAKLRIEKTAVATGAPTEALTPQ
jgi:preprotein translocase subunit YajC